MSEPCRKCEKPLGRADRFCGTCGEPTARLAWKGTDRDEWSTGSGKIPLTIAGGAVAIVLRNEGVNPLAVGITSDTLDVAPPWLDVPALRDTRFPIFLDAGEERALKIPLVPPQIDAALQPAGVNDGTRVSLSHPIRLVTTAALPAGTHPPVFEVLLAIARVPWIDPPGVHFPYLAAEHLAGPGLICELELVNDSADEISLSDLRLSDADALSGIGTVDCATIIRELPAIKGKTLGAGKRLKLPLVLQDPGGHTDGEARWFNIDVAVALHSPIHDDDQIVQAVVQGFIGRGPRLECKSSRTLICERQFADWTAKIEIYNPAPIPVRIEAVTTVDGEGKSRPSPDWLTMEGQSAAAGLLVPAHSTHVFELRIEPARRPRDERSKEICTRHVRITHDGHPAGDVIEVTVQARLGEVVLPTNVVLGVDFGTSNSTVWLVSTETEDEGLAVEIPSAPKRDRMASAMYYRGPRADRTFDYGVLALRQSDIEPRNLVRGVKTLINQQKRQEHHFVAGTTGYVRMHATELLSDFIGELHRRANRNINELGARRRTEFGFPSVGEVMVPRAVFTHPVGPSPAMIAALHRAAVNQGLIEEAMDLEDFQTSRCVDEATAAIVAYVWLRALGRLQGHANEADQERVLCVDIGGGTMDVAAAEIRDFEQYQLTGAQVTVRLRASEGDSRFGGDHVDQLIAKSAIEALGRRASELQIDLPMRVLIAAAEYSESFSGFRDWYDHNQHLWHALSQEDLQRIYARVGQLRAAVEEQKKSFDGLRDFKFPFNPGDLQGRGAAAVISEQIEVVLPGPGVAAMMLNELQTRLSIIDKVCRRAEWRLSDIDTVLLTGQTNYYQGYCDAVEAYLQQGRSPESTPLNVVTPSKQSALCPKGCVALGAAVWGVSQIAIEGWLTIDCEVARQMTFDLQMLRGPGRFVPIEGLTSGATFPARGEVLFPPGKLITALTLYRDGRPYVDIAVPEATSKLTVEVRGPRDIWIFAGDDREPRLAACRDVG